MDAVATASQPGDVAPTGVSGLRLWGVTAGYGEVTVLRDVSLAFPAGETTAVVGPNGAGKTTLLRTILGMTTVRSGRIELDGRDIAGWPTHRLAGAGFCYIPEGRAIHRSLTVEENIRLMAGRDFRSVAPRIYDVFPVLAGRAKQQAGTLSGGEQQMLAMSRGLIGDHKYLLVDELSMGLAPGVVDQLFAVLDTLRSVGLSIVIVEQYVERALAVSDVAYVMTRGEVSLAGDASEFRSHPELLSVYLESG